MQENRLDRMKVDPSAPKACGHLFKEREKRTAKR